MPRPGFYNDNINRSYPFLHGQTDDLPDFVVADFGSIVRAASGFTEGEDTIYLSRIRKALNVIEIEFRSTAPGLDGYVLLFSRDIGDPDYTTSYASAVHEDDLTSFISNCIENCEVDSSTSNCTPEPAPEPCHGDEIWSGFLVTGDLVQLIAFLDDCELVTCPGIDVSLCTWEGEVPVEPSLIQNLAGSYVRSVNIANAERTRATTPTECKEYCWPFPLQEHYVACECIIGPIKFKEGYNACISQDDINSIITISACVGGGAGEPCEDVPVVDSEGPPDGRDTLDGALKCDDVVRSINGVGKRYFEILGGPGVTVTSVPEEHKIIIDVNLQTLAICLELREQSSLDSSSSSLGSCDCGEE